MHRTYLSRPLLRAAATDQGDAGGGSIQAADDPKLSLLDRFKALTTSKEGLQARLTTAETRATDAEAKLTAMEERATAAEARVTKLEAEAAEMETLVAATEKANQDLTAKEQDLANRASAEAKLIVQGVGIDPNKLPAATGGGSTAATGQDAYAKAIEQHSKLTDPKERAAFWAGTIQPLLG